MQRYEYRKLRGRIVEKYGSQKAFSEAIGIAPNSLSMKLTGKIQLSQRDMDFWAKLLDIAFEEYHEYFFA